MRMRAECVPCLLKRTIYEALLVNRKLVTHALQEALQILARKYSARANSVKVATEVHRKVYKVLKNEDPYKELKAKSNRIALKLLPKAKKLVEKAEDRLEAAALCSIIGNVLDFGLASSYERPERLLQEFDLLYREGFGVNELHKARKYLKPRSKIVFIPDNCGEIVFDKLLCSELKMLDVELTIIAKNSPMLTDVTIKELNALSFKRLANKILNSTNAVGIDFRELKKDVIREIVSANLIICKGMGLYEAFCDTHYRPVLHLLRTKCLPVAEDMKVEVGISVAKLYT
jgi:hypothetical protein